MKAVVLTKYGSPDALQLQELEKPTPKDNEALIEVKVATVTAGDCEIRAMKFPFWIAFPMRLYIGVLKPRRTMILGQEFAGVVEAVGKDVTRFSVGDEVFGSTGFGFGAYGEYMCLPEESDDGVMALKPQNMSFEEAAAVPTGGLESLHFLRLADVREGQKILINGGGGSIGTFGVQLAKHYGLEVTAVDSAPKLDMLRALGADHVIDYAQEDFTQNGQLYDIIFDVVGKSHYTRSVKSLTENGCYLIANPRMWKMIRAGWTSRRSSKKVFFAFAGREKDDLLTLKDMAEAGIIKTVIDKRYPLDEVPEAHRYVEAGHKKGNVIITF